MNIEAELNKLHSKHLRTKLVIFSIVGFLILITYLLITVSQQIASTDSMNYQSRAADYYGAPNNGDQSELNNNFGDYSRDGEITSDTSNAVPGQGCPAYEKSIEKIDEPGGMQVDWCKITYTCGAQCKCTNNPQTVTVTCRGGNYAPNQNPNDPYVRVPCDYENCNSQAVAACNACEQLTATPIMPTVTPLNTPTPQVLSCEENITWGYKRCGSVRETGTTCMACPDPAPDGRLCESRNGLFIVSYKCSPSRGEQKTYCTNDIAACKQIIKARCGCP